ncbi:predicted protein [Botrytis cinerea T4]|uniref:Uncharacterized protein n=1 Tax=Botryotinia fuckeliana (strain T4) TaxID=999810 RepID=G2YWL1_BOTF4|nr:predicted protein [Botrytis cinerea T4]
MKFGGHRCKAIWGDSTHQDCLPEPSSPGASTEHIRKYDTSRTKPESSSISSTLDNLSSGT